MVRQRVKSIATSLMLVGALSVPAVASADHRHRHSNHCRHYSSSRHIVNDGYSRGYGRGYGHGYQRGYERRGYARRGYDRRVVYNDYRPARRVYYERAPRRSKARSALVIAGSAATGAGIGGALRGGKGALVGAAIGGGAASIYEGARRRR